MTQGNYRSTSLRNYTSTLFFTPSKYRAIPPHDAGSLLGFVSRVIISQVNKDDLTTVNPGTIICRYLYYYIYSVRLANASSRQCQFDTWCKLSLLLVFLVRLTQNFIRITMVCFLCNSPRQPMMSR